MSTDTPIAEAAGKVGQPEPAIPIPELMHGEINEGTEANEPPPAVPTDAPPPGPDMDVLYEVSQPMPSDDFGTVKGGNVKVGVSTIAGYVSALAAALTPVVAVLIDEDLGTTGNVIMVVIAAVLVALTDVGRQWQAR